MKTNVDYRALTSIEAVQVNTGQFIGDTSTPDHLVEEVLDNMLDEVNEYGKIGSVFFDTENKSVWITDDGRGFKIGETKDPDTGQLKDSIELIVTKLYSGSKFRINDENDYKTQIGMHGVGLTAVNALSDWFVISTRDRNNLKNIHYYKFENAQLTEKQIFQDENAKYTTMVGFKPSSKYFSSLDFNIQKFAKRLVLAQCLLSDCKFIINNQEIPNINLIDLVKKELNLKSDEQLFELEYKISEFEKIKIYFTYVNDLDTVSNGIVNLRECEGTYITNFHTILKNILKDKIDKKFKKINSNELLCGLRSYIIMTIPKLIVDSQTKTRMKNDITKLFLQPLQNQLENICSNKSILNIIESVLSRKFSKKNLSVKTFNKRVSSSNKLRDCENIPGDVLYIVEGDSADGSLKEIKNIKCEASYPLKGKCINVEKASFEKLSSNKEFKELKEALGPKNNKKKKKIKILTDADVDGYHIAVLVILILMKIADDMIKSGNVSIIIPPLYGVYKGNNKSKYIPVYKIEELKKYIEKGFNYTRFKGLGEMDPDQLEPVIRSNIEYIVKWPDTEKQLTDLMAMVMNTDIRKILLNVSECSFDKILETVLKEKSHVTA